MIFNTPYNRSKSIVGENYKKVKSCTQPEQVLPLKRILDGLRNGSIILNAHPLDYDIPEHEIEFDQGLTATETNANIANAVANDLAQSADKSGENITAAPGFTIEDAHPLIDSVEGSIEAQDAIKGGIVGDGVGGSSLKSKSDDIVDGDDGSHPSGDASNGN